MIYVETSINFFFIIGGHRCVGRGPNLQRDDQAARAKQRDLYHSDGQRGADERASPLVTFLWHHEGRDGDRCDHRANDFRRHRREHF